MFSYRKVGGLHFIRIGQFGCSFYVTQKHESLISHVVTIDTSLTALLIVAAIANLF